MRYIGSKVGMLQNLESVCPAPAQGDSIFLDIFGGTGAVGRHFKPGFTVYANDVLYFAFALLHAQIAADVAPTFPLLRKETGCGPYEFLNAIDQERFAFTADPFVHQQFSPDGPDGRMYFTPSTALRIDAVRQQIAAWRTAGLIDETEYLSLIAALVSAVPSVSNIAGTYGAYLKKWDPRTKKQLELVPLPVTTNGRPNRAFQSDGAELITQVSGEVLYLDPPYNARQYLSNYHVLETIALYDSPTLKGKTGTRADSTKSSDFCRRAGVEPAFSTVLRNADFRTIIISYSNEGLLTEQRLVELLEEHASPRRITAHRFPYRRYSRVTTTKTPELHELVLVAER